MRPVDDDLVGVREPLRRGEDRPRVADGHLVAEEGTRPGRPRRRSRSRRRRASAGAGRGSPRTGRARRRGARRRVRSGAMPVRPPASRPRPSSVTASSSRGRAEAARAPVGPDHQPPAEPVGRALDAGHHGDRLRRPRWSAATSSSSGNAVWSTRSTKRSMMPPQVRPTSKASSSLTPYRCSFGVSGLDRLLAQLVHRALDAAAGDAADGGAVRADQHGRAGRPRARCARCRPPWPCLPAGPRATNESAPSARRALDHLVPAPAELLPG